MVNAGVGYSVSNNPKVAAAEATQEAMRQAGLHHAAGALCFATTAHGAAFTAIMRTVSAEARTRDVAGCSGAGVIAAEHEIESGPAVAVIVFGGTSLGAKRLFVPSLRGRAREVAGELAAAARPALGVNNLLCLFADTYNMEPDALLEALARELPGVTVVGGGASEDGSIGETFQFCGDTVSSNAVAGMLLSGDFDLNVGASQACTPLGRTYEVTAVRDNILIELDGRRAFDVFAEAAGPLAQDLRRAAAFVFLGIPLDHGAERMERGNYLVRNIVGASAEHGVLALAHRPRIGDRVGFVLRNGERAREDLKATLEELKERTTATPPAFGLYFDCVSRGAGLYNIPDHDSAYIARYLGHVPVAGFFTGFEIGPLGARPGMLQYSGVLALISEKRG
jgi:small ligand-binding sensory domain FIST